MALEKISEDLSYISRLDDEPNDVGGLSAAELKAEFDRAANFIKNYINTVLIPGLEGPEGAGSIGMEPVAGLTGVSDIQAAFEKVEKQMADITQGSVADGSISAEKLAAGAVTALKLAELCVGTAAIANGAVTGEKIAGGAVNAQKLAGLSVTAAKLAESAVTTAKLADKSVTTAKIGDNAVGSEQLDDMSVGTAHLQAGAVTRAKLGSDVTAAALGGASLAGGKVKAGEASAATGEAAASFTVEGSMAGKFIRVKNTGAAVVTVPADGTEALEIGTEIEFMQEGEGELSFAAEEGVTLLSLDGALTMAGQYGCAAVKKLEANLWVLSGAIG